MAEVLARLAVLFLLSHLMMCEAFDCYQAVTDCKTDAKCAIKLGQYTKECESIVDLHATNSNTSKYPCSTSCVRAIKSLRQTSKGGALWNCNCRLDLVCLSLRARTEKCLAIANGTYRTRVGCTKAHYECMRDSRCREAQMNFLEKCALMFTLTACRDQCLCSQKRLFNLPVGRPLMNCECDGSDELYCLGFRAYAKKMKCNWKKVKRSRKKLKKRCKRCKQKQKGNKCGRREKSKRKD